MYNFRYHLVTIVSIFVSLLIGLLLGAAITGSDLVRNTSDELVDSLLTRFDNLSAENAALTEQLSTEGALAGDYYKHWAQGRLDGRTIIVLASQDTVNEAATASIRDALRDGGAAVVTIALKVPAFGLNDPEIAAALQAVVAPVNGQRYENTLAHQLVAEWTYYSDDNGSMELTEEDLRSLSNRPSDQTANLTAFQKTINAHYPLTLALIKHDIISIEANYRPLISHRDPSCSREQRAVLLCTELWGLPYGVNGVVNTLTIGGSADTMIVDPVGFQIAVEFNTLVTQPDSIPYPTWLSGSLMELLDSSDEEENSELEESTNYVVLLAAIDSSQISLAYTANEQGLSCVVNTMGVCGRYSIVALLSGAQSGVYGHSGVADARFPAIPLDATGHIPFMDNSSNTDDKLDVEEEG